MERIQNVPAKDTVTKEALGRIEELRESEVPWGKVDPFVNTVKRQNLD